MASLVLQLCLLPGAQRSVPINHIYRPLYLLLWRLALLCKKEVILVIVRHGCSAALRVRKQTAMHVVFSQACTPGIHLVLTTATVRNLCCWYYLDVIVELRHLLLARRALHLCGFAFESRGQAGVFSVGQRGMQHKYQ